MPLSLVGRSFSNNLCHRACLELVQRLTLWGHSRFGSIRLDLDRLNQARVIVSPARRIDPFRDRPHAQKVIRRGLQQLNADLSS